MAILLKVLLAGAFGGLLYWAYAAGVNRAGWFEVAILLLALLGGAAIVAVRKGV